MALLGRSAYWLSSTWHLRACFIPSYVNVRDRRHSCLQVGMGALGLRDIVNLTWGQDHAPFLTSHFPLFFRCILCVIVSVTDISHFVPSFSHHLAALLSKRLIWCILCWFPWLVFDWWFLYAALCQQHCENSFFFFFYLVSSFTQNVKGYNHFVLIDTYELKKLTAI